MIQAELISMFADKGFLMNREALAYLQGHDCNEVLSRFKETSPDTLVIDLPSIRRVLRLDQSKVTIVNVEEFPEDYFWNRYDDEERQIQKNILRQFGILPVPKTELKANQKDPLQIMTNITTLKLESRATELKQAGASERSIASILSSESNQNITKSAVHRYLQNNLEPDSCDPVRPEPYGIEPVYLEPDGCDPVRPEPAADTHARACGLCKQPLCIEPFEVVKNTDVHTRCKNVIVRVRALRNVDYISPVTRAHVRMIEGQSYDIPAFQAVEDIRLRLVEKVVDRADVCPKPQSVNPIGNNQR
jgi:hypothetical protein